MSEFCQNCFKGSVISGDPKGSLEKIAGIDCYVSPPGTPENSSKAIILAYDIFGFYLPNPKILADTISKGTGIQVFVPDALVGDYVKSLKPAVKPFKKDGIISTIMGVSKMIGSMIGAGALGVMWRLDKQVLAKRYEDSILEIKNQRGIQKVGMVGYCLGAYPCGQFCSRPDLIDTAVLCHPSGISADIIKSSKIPLSFACAEEDEVLPEKERIEIEKVLKNLEIKSEMKVYDGCTHGFASRPDLTLPAMKIGFQEAMKQTIEWFKIYV